MLLVAGAGRRDRAGFDRRRREGAGPPADAWAAGCLLFELLARALLFQDADWIRFFMRVTQHGQARAWDPDPDPRQTVCFYFFNQRMLAR
jgi:hypothetical protein